MVEFPVDKPTLRAHVCRNDQKNSSTLSLRRTGETVLQKKVSKVTEMKPIYLSWIALTL
ncbi:MAG: hypothetical protein K2X93_19385 [Candidatus Obscuribacterales bacterium]|nr:hypothetical protein [Candidatus Obscuribacterales bacterium]